MFAGLICLAFLFPCLSWAFTSDAYPITFPRHLGAITHHSRNGQRLVICLQDLHCNYEVQKNIADIMQVLARDYGLRLVAVEGASRSLNVTKIAGFPLETIKRQTADYRMRQGKITGPEFYAATGKYPVQLEGIEDAGLYAAERAVMKSFFNDENLGLVTDVREALQSLKSRLYSKALQSLDAKKTAYRSGKLALLPYCLYLADLANRNRLETKALPAFTAYVSRVQAGPETVDPERLIGEMEVLESGLRVRLYQNDDQRRLDELERRLDVMEKLLSISATPDEVREFRSRPQDFTVSAFADFIQRFQAANDPDGLPEAGSLDQALQAVLRFYQVADQRSAAFVRNTMQRMSRQKAEVALLVTGGYHTSDIMEALEQQGVSCLCIQPRLTRFDLANPYFSLLRNNRMPLEKLLAQNQKILALVPSSPETEPAQARVRLHPDQLSAEQRTFYTLVETFHKLGLVAAWLQNAKERTASGLKTFYTGWQQKADWDDRLIQPDLDSWQGSGRGYRIIFAACGLAAVYQHLSQARVRIAGTLAELPLGNFAISVIPRQQLQRACRDLERTAAARGPARIGRRAWFHFQDRGLPAVTQILQTVLAHGLVAVMTASLIYAFAGRAAAAGDVQGRRREILAALAGLHRRLKTAPVFACQSALEASALAYQRLITPEEYHKLRAALAGLDRREEAALDHVRQLLFALTPMAALKKVFRVSGDQYEHVVKVGDVLFHLEEWRGGRETPLALERYFQESLRLAGINYQDLQRIVDAYAGLTPWERRVLVISALLHDYGKVISVNLVGMEGLLGSNLVNDLLERLEQAGVIDAGQKRLCGRLINSHMHIDTLYFMESPGVSGSELEQAFQSDPELQASYFRLMPLLYFLDIAGNPRPIVTATDLRNVEFLMRPQQYFGLLRKLPQVRLSEFFSQATKPLDFSELLGRPESAAIPENSTLRTLPPDEQEFLTNHFLARLFMQGYGNGFLKMLAGLSQASADKFVYFLSCLCRHSGYFNLALLFEKDILAAPQRLHARLEPISLEGIRLAFASHDQRQTLCRNLGLEIIDDPEHQLHVLQFRDHRAAELQESARRRIARQIAELHRLAEQAEPFAYQSQLKAQVMAFHNLIQPVELQSLRTDLSLLAQDRPGAFDRLRETLFSLSAITCLEAVKHFGRNQFDHIGKTGQVLQHWENWRLQPGSLETLLLYFRDDLKLPLSQENLHRLLTVYAGLGSEDRQVLALAVLLHDYGKLIAGDLVGMEGILGTRIVDDLLRRLEQGGVISARQRILAGLLINRHMDINTMHFLEASGVTEEELAQAIGSDLELRAAYFRLMPLVFFFDLAGYPRPILEPAHIRNVEILFDPQAYGQILARTGQARISRGFRGQGFIALDYQELLKSQKTGAIPQDSLLQSLPETEQVFIREKFLPSLFIQGHGMMLVRELNQTAPASADKLIYLMSRIYQATGHNRLTYRFPGDQTAAVVQRLHSSLQTLSLEDIRSAFRDPDGRRKLEQTLGLQVFTDDTYGFNVIQIPAQEWVQKNHRLRGLALDRKFDPAFGLASLPAKMIDNACLRAFGPTWGPRVSVVVVRSALETLAFPLAAAFFGIPLWATVGFAFAHTIVEWHVRAKAGGAAAVFHPQALAQDTKDFALRAGLGWVFLAPFTVFASYLTAFLLSFTYHGAYNALASAYNRFLQPKAVKIFSRLGLFSRAAWDRLLTLPIAAIGSKIGFNPLEDKFIDLIAKNGGISDAVKLAREGKFADGRPIRQITSLDFRFNQIMGTSLAKIMLSFLFISLFGYSYFVLGDFVAGQAWEKALMLLPWSAPAFLALKLWQLRNSGVNEGADVRVWYLNDEKQRAGQEMVLAGIKRVAGIRVLYGYCAGGEEKQIPVAKITRMDVVQPNAYTPVIPMLPVAPEVQAGYLQEMRRMYKYLSVDEKQKWIFVGPGMEKFLKQENLYPPILQDKDPENYLVSQGAQVMVFEPDPTANKLWKEHAQELRGKYPTASAGESNQQPKKINLAVYPARFSDFTRSKIPKGSVDGAVIKSVHTFADMLDIARRERIVRKAIQAVKPGGTLVLGYYQQAFFEQNVVGKRDQTLVLVERDVVQQARNEEKHHRQVIERLRKAGYRLELMKTIAEPPSGFAHYLEFYRVHPPEAKKARSRAAAAFNLVHNITALGLSIAGWLVLQDVSRFWDWTFIGLVLIYLAHEVGGAWARDLGKKPVVRDAFWEKWAQAYFGRGVEVKFASTQDMQEIYLDSVGQDGKAPNAWQRFLAPWNAALTMSTDQGHTVYINEGWVAKSDSIAFGVIRLLTLPLTLAHEDSAVWLDRLKFPALAIAPVRYLLRPFQLLVLYPYLRFLGPLLVLVGLARWGSMFRLNHHVTRNEINQHLTPAAVKASLSASTWETFILQRLGTVWGRRVILAIRFLTNWRLTALTAPAAGMDNQPASATTLTDGLARRMGEAEARELSRRIVDELKLKRLKDTDGQCVVEGSEYAYDRHVMAKPGSTAEGVPGYSEVYIRVGFLFFMDPAAYAQLSSGLKIALGSNVILVPELNERNMTGQDRNFNVFSFAALLAMFTCDLSHTCCIESGAGDGMLSVAAFKLGAPLVQLVDKEERLLARARRILEANHLTETQHYHILRGDLKQPKAIATNLRPTDLPIAMISNIGHWPYYYTVTNQDSMALMPYLKNVKYFIAGGYWVHPQSGILGANLNADLKRSGDLGMQPDGDKIWIKDTPDGGKEYTTAAVAWVARARRPNQPADTQKEMEGRVIPTLLPDRPHSVQEMAESLKVPASKMQVLLDYLVAQGQLELPVDHIYTLRPVIQPAATTVLDADSGRPEKIQVEQVSGDASGFAFIRQELKEDKILGRFQPGKDYADMNGLKYFLLVARKGRTVLGRVSLGLSPIKHGRFGTQNAILFDYISTIAALNNHLNYRGVGFELLRAAIRFAIASGYLTRDDRVFEAMNHWSGAPAGNDFAEGVIMHGPIITGLGEEFILSTEAGDVVKNPDPNSDIKSWWYLDARSALKFYLRQTLRTQGPLTAEALWNTDNLRLAYTLENIKTVLAELAREEKVQADEKGLYSYSPSRGNVFKQRTWLPSLGAILLAVFGMGLGMQLLLPGYNAQSEWGGKAAAQTGIFNGLYLPNGWGIVNWLGLDPLFAVSLGLVGIAALAAATASLSASTRETIILQRLGPVWGQRAVLAVRWITNWRPVTMTAPASGHGSIPDAEKSPIAGINSSPASIRTYIESKVNQIAVTQNADLVRDFWKTALADPQNPVITSLESLGRAGVKSRTLENLIDVLMALGVNVTNPWTATYHLSDIVGYLTPALLGEDISCFKELCRANEFHGVSLTDKADSIQIPENVSDLTWPELEAMDRKIKEEQERLVLSKQPFDRIAREVAGSSNELVTKLLKTFIERIWHDLGVPGDSPALVFFRDCKTFASDLDIYYWGPEAEKVNLELSRLFFLLGFKRDLFSTFLLDREIKEGQIDFYTYAYFSTVECVEFNGASASKFYQREIKSKLDADKVWQEIHPYLCRQLAKWNGITIEDDLPVTLDDIKKLQHRAIGNLIFGLCCKFKIDFGLDNPSIFDALQKHMPPAEVAVLVKALGMVNQARNLNQIITRRRWENIDSRTREKIAGIMASQGLPEFDQKVRDMGEALEALRQKYFGRPDYRPTVYLPLKSDARAIEAWRRVAAAYLQICRENNGQTSERDQNSPAQKSTAPSPAATRETIILQRLGPVWGQRVVKVVRFLASWQTTTMAAPASGKEQSYTAAKFAQAVADKEIINGANIIVAKTDGQSVPFIFESLGSRSLQGYDLQGRSASLAFSEIAGVQVRTSNLLQPEGLVDVPIPASEQARYLREHAALFDQMELPENCRVVSVGPGEEYYQKMKKGYPFWICQAEPEYKLLARGASLTIYETDVSANAFWGFLAQQVYTKAKQLMVRTGPEADFSRDQDIPDASQDAVIMQSVVSDHAEVDFITRSNMLFNLARILKPGGYLLLGHYQASAIKASNIFAPPMVRKTMGDQGLKEMAAAREKDRTEAAVQFLRDFNYRVEFVGQITDPPGHYAHVLNGYRVYPPEKASSANPVGSVRATAHGDSESSREEKINGFIQPGRPYTGKHIAGGLHLPLQDIQAALKKMSAAGLLEEPVAGIYVRRPVIQPAAAKVFNAALGKDVSIMLEQVTRTKAGAFAIIKSQLKHNTTTFGGILDGRDYSEDKGEKAYLLTAREENRLLASLSMKIPRLEKKDGPTGIMLHLLEENEKGITDAYKGIGSELFKSCIRFAITLGYITRDQGIHEAIYGPGPSGKGDGFDSEIAMHSYAISRKGARFAKNAQVGTLTKDRQKYLVWQLTPKDLLEYYLRQTLRTHGPMNAEALWHTDNLQVGYTLEQVDLALDELIREDKVRRDESGQYSFVPNHVLANPLNPRTLMNAVAPWILTVIAAVGIRLLVPGYNAQSEWGMNAATQAGIFSGLHLPGGLGMLNWLGLPPVLVAAVGSLGIVLLVLILQARLTDGEKPRVDAGNLASNGSGRLQILKRLRHFRFLAVLVLLALPQDGMPRPARAPVKGYVFSDFSGFVAEGKVAAGANIEVLKTDDKTISVIFTGIDAKTGLLRGYTLDGKPYSIKGKNIKYIHVRSTNILHAESPYSRLLSAEEQVRQLQKINGLLRRMGIKAGDHVASVGPGDEYWEKGRAGMAPFIMDLNFETYWANQGAEVTVYETGQPNAQWRKLAAGRLRSPGRLNVMPPDQADFSQAELQPGSMKAVVMKSVLSDGQIPDPVKKSIILKAGQGLQPGGHLVIGCYNAAHFGSPAVRSKAEAAADQGIITEAELRMTRAVVPDEKAKAELALTETYLDRLRSQGYQVNRVDKITEPGDYLSHDVYIYQVFPPKQEQAGPGLNAQVDTGQSALQTSKAEFNNGHPYIQALLLRYGLETVADLQRQTPEQAVSRLSLQTAPQAGRLTAVPGALWGASRIEAAGPETGKLAIYTPAVIWRALVLPEGYASLQEVVKFNEQVILRHQWLDRLPWARAALMLFTGAALHLLVLMPGRSRGWAAWLAEKHLILIIEHQTGKVYRQSRQTGWGLNRAIAGMFNRTETALSGSVGPSASVHLSLFQRAALAAAGALPAGMAGFVHSRIMHQQPAAYFAALQAATEKRGAHADQPLAQELFRPGSQLQAAYGRWAFTNPADRQAWQQAQGEFIVSLIRFMSTYSQAHPGARENLDNLRFFTFFLEHMRAVVVGTKLARRASEATSNAAGTVAVPVLLLGKDYRSQLGSLADLLRPWGWELDPRVKAKYFRKSFNLSFGGAA